MGERDVPSVPVTTLAGLNSLSDLLSELPVSDSFQSVTPLNKSLLFHTLVANESNNLLSVRDDNLVRQLVNAIEQTNSDNIELKPQYSIQQHGTNISTYPELLQGIYNFRPTVFNTPNCIPNHMQQQQFYQTQPNYPQHQTNPITQNVTVGSLLPHNEHLMNDGNSLIIKNSTMYDGNLSIQQHNPHEILGETNVNVHLQQPNLSNQMNAFDAIKREHLTFASTESNMKYLGEQQSLASNQQQQQQQNVHNNTKQEVTSPEMLAAQMQQVHHLPQINMLHRPIEHPQLSNQTSVIQQTTHDLHVAQHQLLQRPPMNQQAQSVILNTDLAMRQQQQQHQSMLGNSHMQQQLQNEHQHDQQHMIISPQNELQNFVSSHSIMAHSTNSDPQQPKSEPIHGNFQNVLNLQRQQMQKLIDQQKQSSEPQQKISIGVENNLIDSSNRMETSLLSSPGSIDKSQVRVCINRIKDEDAKLMQQSLKEFVQKSPEVAKKLGLPVTGDVIMDASDGLGNVQHKNAKVSPIDTFSKMKADEKFATKRKLLQFVDDIPPEQIFSKPKVRRVERMSSTPLPKCSKEEVMRSQTYQQFMQNMEQIIELLDDTEPPNFESDDIDENIECISSKLLHTMSNDVAKLKAKQVLDCIPKNKLTLLINYAMRNVYLSKNYSAGPDDEDEIVDDEIMEKILNAVEACLLVCNIYSTAKDLKFLQEDNISLIIKFVQFQLRETIFPSYDPVYTVKSMKKSDSRKKTKSQLNHSRNLQLLYSKTVELMKVFVTLFDKCIFVDTIVLPLSTLAIEPFFVDNIETLQFVCLELVTTIFRKERYDKIRSSILGDILSSIDRLPSSKKNLRPFKLTNNGGNIQMVTALVLQLIQCATILPDSVCDSKSTFTATRFTDLNNETPSGAGEKIDQPNNDVVVLKKYDVAISIGGNFLTTFLNKCKTRSNDTDFRPLFENFIHDLLATVNKPEWPASELLLSLLGTMLVRYVSDKSIEQSIRLVSLDYLGIVAARLRKDTVESRCKVNIIDSMIMSIKAEQEKEGDTAPDNKKIILDPEEERMEFLQKILLDFLAVNAQEENLIWDYARHFYLSQWYRDVIYQKRRIAGGEKSYASRKKNTTRKRRKKGNLSETSDTDSNDDSCDEDNPPNRNCAVTDQELNLEIFNVLEERKRYLLSNVKVYSYTNDSNHTSQHIKTYIDYNNAHLIAQYIATKRPFSQSFDGYLKKIILVVNEPSIAVRTRAMKCLANIVEVDPMVLRRKDMQMGVNQKFLDAAISVREAAVDLVGKFVLSNEELIDQYYDMLSARILDTGVSVRKRVIKILRDICIEYPDFEKIPEICVKMIRRVNDEEGIQKLVTEVFMKMWFIPCRKDDKHGIQRKINQIIDVVNTAHDTGTAWLEGLLTSIFQPKENMMKLDGSAQEPVKKNTEPPQEIVLACQQLADGLVDRLIELEDTDNARMLGCVVTLHLLAKVRPQLLVRHAITIEPYLSIRCHASIAPKFICAVADILEKVVPLVNNASESFLATLEEHLMLLVVSLNQAVVTSCVSCLGALVNKITKNYKLIRDCFQKFYRILDLSRTQVVQNNYKIDLIYTPKFRRSLFTIGILMRYFDFKSEAVIGDGNGSLPVTICDDAFENLMFFVQCSNHEIRKQALIALGSFCVLNDDYLTRSELRKFYCDLLISNLYDASIKIICMRNIWIYLTESEMYMHNKEKEWEKQAKHEDLKEMNDVSSGMASRIIQLYLQEILDCFLHSDDQVRLWAVKVVQIVLRQGLVHPVRMVPYLICLSTDSKLESAHRADALLKDIDKTYAGFVNMKVQFGLQLCFKLQEILQCNNIGKNNVIRGYVRKKDSDTVPTALNDFLYTLLRATKPQRRALVQAVTKQFDDQKTSLRQMLYIADNLAYFPYVVQDEPLYLIHQIDLLISMAGTNILATFKECLKPNENTCNVLEDDDDEEDPEILIKRLPDNTSDIQKCITSAQACMLLLILKEHLKDMYGLTDGKLSRYSPSEQKIYEKAVTRKNVSEFNPKTIIEFIKNQESGLVGSLMPEPNVKELSQQEKMDLVIKYLDFKQLMLKLDPEDADSDDENRDKSKINHTINSDITPTTSILNSTMASSRVSGADMSTFLSPTNMTNCSNMSLNQSKDTPGTPTSRTPNAKSSTKKQSQRTKRKKRKLSSDDDDNSDEDYA